MKKVTNYYLALKILTGLGALSLVSCAHELSPVKYSAMAIPGTEIQNQRSLMNQAQENQVDVLAATPFKKADVYLTDAQNYNAKSASAEKILETVGYSQAYLNKAINESNTVRPSVTEVTDARSAALIAGAYNNFPKELANIDKNFKSMTSRPQLSDKITSTEKSELQSKYLGLELVTIKQVNLGETKNIINLAKKKGAEKITPLAYKEAEEKINIAEKIIETDRHNRSKISPAIEIAKASSLRVFTLLASEKNSRSQTPEQRAMTLEARDMALQEANLITSEVAADSIIKDQKLAIKDQKIAVQNENLAVSEESKQKLLDREYDEKIVNNAAAQFDKNEADVYRQDGNLVIRLKSMNFASNRSDLPADSLAVLNKVKNVMKELAPESVMVEGHTDAVGNSVKNQKLSEKRAQAVVKYFASEKFLGGNILDSTGFGYSKPLASNKTKEGRAQNRRVDIIIKTNQTKTL